MIVGSLANVGMTNAKETILVKPGFRSAAFNGVLDARGEFKLGVADMDVLQDIPIEHINKFDITQSEVVIIDGNIGADTMGQILS